MKFKSISIKNFRNFEFIKIALDNKNVFFGMNDVGKTNFLYALRFVFDREIRKKNLLESDFYQRKTQNPIEITICIDISDIGDVDSNKLRAKVKGAILSSHDCVYIKMKAEYDNKEMFGNPVLYWGGDLTRLQEIKFKGYSCDLDSVFNVIYIDAYVDLYSLFRKNTSVLLKNDDDADKDTLDTIQHTIETLNESISSLSGIRKFESEVLPEYRSFRDDKVEVTIKSEIAVNGIYSNVAPYIKKDGCDELYPTSGEGRKKLLVYSIYDLIAKESNAKKINIFLIEEPENHLHRAMQLNLSHRLFIDEKYKYMFLTTHSSYVLSEMDKVNLVRIYNNTKIDSSSAFYIVPKEFENQKQRLNKGIVEAIFAEKVLLVEGPSEEILFSKVLFEADNFYESNGIYILSVNGIGFKEYYSLLNSLRIKCFIRTDNDLKKYKGHSDYSVIGFSRINGILKDSGQIKNSLLPENRIIGNSVSDRSHLYDNNKSMLDTIRIYFNIYLSHVGLEEDLYEAIPTEMDTYLTNATNGAVAYLQDSKKYNMVELVSKLTQADCKKILSHYNFKCLEDILK